MKKLIFAGIFVILLFFISIVAIYIALKPSELKKSLQIFADMYLSTHRTDEYISTVGTTVQCQNKNGHTILDSAYAGTLGFGDNTTEKRKTGKDNIFQIGSITKSFISVVLLQLEEETKNTSKPFSIDDTVEKWFPENAYKNWHSIKIRQLLNMTSGIFNYVNDLTLTDFYSKNPYHDFSLEEILKYETSKPLSFNPGAKSEYSNTNYTLAGLLIERITGNSVQSEVTKRVIDKLGLKYTFFPKNLIQDHYPYNKLVHGYFLQKPYMYFFENHKEVTDFGLSLFNSAGGIVSNTEDINAYIQALFMPGKLLSDTQIKKLQTYEPQLIWYENEKMILYYALGVVKFHDKVSNEDFYSYSGMTFGYRFHYTYYPNRNLNIVFAVNSSAYVDPAPFVQDTIVQNIWHKICY